MSANIRGFRTRISPAMVMALGAAVAFVLILYLGRHLTTFLYDEWNIFINRRPWDVDTLLRPHNEHLVAAPVVLFKLFFEAIGAAPYWPYRVAIALVVVALGVMVYRFAAPRLGKEAALVPGFLTVLIGAGGQDIIWPFQVALGLSTLGGVGLLLCLDRGTPKAEWLAGGSILLALASSSVGVAVLAAGVVDVLVHPGRLHRGVRILALPAVLYGLWYSKYNATHFERENLVATPQYAIDAAGGAVGALVGLSESYYPVLSFLFVGCIVWGYLRPGPMPLRFVTIITLPLAFWLLTAIGRADEGQPTTSRYLLPGAIFVALVACEALRGIRWPRRTAMVAAALVAFASWNHVAALRVEARGQFDGFTSYVRAELAAMDFARQAGAIAPGYKPDPVRAPDIVAAPYFSAVDNYGSPVPDGSRTLARSSSGPRQSADAVYFAALGVGVRPSKRPPFASAVPEVVESSRGPLPQEGPCLLVPPRSAAVFRLPAGGIALHTSGRAEVGLRRWSPAFGKLNGLYPGGWGVVAVGRDSDSTPVTIRVEGAREIRVCGLAYR